VTGEKAMGSDRGDAYIKKMNSLASLLGLIGASIMAGLMVLTVADVVLRAIFNAPILGSFEITELALVPIAFLAMSFAAAKRVHVRVDLIVGKLPQRLLARFDSVTCCLSLIITAFLAWYTIPQTLYIMRLGMRTDMLKIPIYPLYFVVAFGFFLLFFVLLGNLIEIVRRAVKR
jgi:TRAP-type C4-dicarboxylate transport system permease small subunit